MTYAVLLLGATGKIGAQIALKLAKYQDQLKRVAFLTPTADAGVEKEKKYKRVPIPRLVGSYEDPDSYRGFDIVISAVGDPLGEAQIKYIDAAFEGGVSHFYPAEFGGDLKQPELSSARYFVNKLKVRKHLEDKVAKDASKGYTYILVGLFSDTMLEYNILGISEDTKSASFLGEPDSVVTTTHSTDVAALTVLSLLPSHLKSLSERREIKLGGSTHTAAERFEIVSRVLGHEIKVEYLSKEWSYKYEEEQKALGNDLLYHLTSLRRVIGFEKTGFGHDLRNPDYPEIEPQTWEETVREYFKA